MKTAILLHSRDAKEENWKKVVWGTPPDKPGKIPTAVAVALEEDASLIVLFGSSVGKEVNGTWISSGALMAGLLFDRMRELKRFTILQALRETPFEVIRQKVESTFWLVEDFDQPANTMGELKALSRMIHEKDLDIQKLICVSSKDHCSRIFRDAHLVFEGSPLAAHLSVRGSLPLYTEEDGKTPPERASMANVLVFEPRFGLVPIIQQIMARAANPDFTVALQKLLGEYAEEKG